MSDLRDCMRNEDKPRGDSEHGWSAGEQLEALAFYLDPDQVDIAATWDEGDYQGSVLAAIRLGRHWWFWHDYYGSCSGCDALENEDGYEYIADTLVPSDDCVEFKRRAALLEFLRAPGDPWYGAGPGYAAILKALEAQ